MGGNSKMAKKTNFAIFGNFFTIFGQCIGIAMVMTTAKFGAYRSIFVGSSPI